MYYCLEIHRSGIRSLWSGFSPSTDPELNQLVLSAGLERDALLLLSKHNVCPRKNQNHGSVRWSKSRYHTMAMLCTTGKSTCQRTYSCQQSDHGRMIMAQSSRPSGSQLDHTGVPLFHCRERSLVLLQMEKTGKGLAGFQQMLSVSISLQKIEPSFFSFFFLCFLPFVSPRPQKGSHVSQIGLKLTVWLK